MMQLHKTDKARAALLERTDTLTVQDRRILILSDGQRSLDDIVGLLGSPVRPAVLRLMEQRYLATSLASATTVPAIAPSPATLAATHATRRSLAATKMYMLDMLQLRRESEAATIGASIHAAREQDELAAHLLGALRHIHAVTSASYSRRIAERLAEIMPKQYLAELGVFGDALFVGEGAPA